MRVSVFCCNLAQSGIQVFTRNSANANNIEQRLAAERAMLVLS